MNIAFYPEFVRPILTRRKIHTVRRDRENKYKPGGVLHCVHADGFQQFAQRAILSTQEFRVEFRGDDYAVAIDGRWLKTEELRLLIKYDGFKSFAHFEAFINQYKTPDGSPYVGKILHFTSFRYGAV